MSSKYLPEEKKILEKEFSEFLIERIKRAGGSLQIHHLSGLLQQARFDIRDAFGTTKSELMKFLKVHPKIFQIDSVGIVSITSSVSSGDSYDSDTCRSTEKKNNLLPKIEGGIGEVVKLYPEFGIIEAVEPVETEVHFQSEAFCENKDSLLTDSCLKIGNHVYFNAVHGHEDYDIKYRASKVWLKFDRDVTSDNSGGNKSASNLQGEGIIQKIFLNSGFILVFGRENETVFFSKSSVSGCDDNNELPKFLKVGDPVEFSACRTDLKAEWQATVVRKKSKVNSKDNVHPSSDTKKKASVRTTIENEPGKICPHSHGAIIKFGQNYSELADGDASSYFLYGAEVSDIAWEFSEGDDVWFDAVKTKSAPGWKAIFVWVGEKPACAKNKMLMDEEMNEFSDSSCVSSAEISAGRLRSKTKKPLNDASVSEPEMQRKSKVIDPSVKREVSELDLEYKKQNPKSSKSLQSYSAKKSLNKKGGNKAGKVNSSVKKNKGNHHRAAVERKEIFKSNHKDAPVTKHTAARCQSNTELDGISSYCDADFDDNLSCKDDVSDISEGSLQDYKFQSTLNNDKNVLTERYNNIESSSKYNFVDSDENAMDNKYNEIKCYTTTDKKKSSIKKFEDIDGEIVNLYCKAAIVKSPQLQRNVDFVLNVFYINGKSVEEQQVIDLKEIIKVGDHVNFNCFEIRDDKGEIHVKVTKAWKGPKPVVYEMTPEEFIDVYQLSVTIIEQCSPDPMTVSQDFLAEVLNSEAAECCSSNSSSEDVSDAQFKTCEAHIKGKLDEEVLLVDVHHRLLSEVIIHRLKSKGFISSDLQVDFSDVLTPIISLARKYCSGYQSCIMNEEVEKKTQVPKPLCLTCSEKSFSAFSSKNKSEKHAAVQTIITGGIVAQSIYTQN